MIVIRSCEADGRSWRGFIWPLEVGAVVEAPDWDPAPECGKGLHGLRPGDNDPGEWYVGVYMALEVSADEVVDLGGKCKFPRATVLYVAPDMGALSQWLSANGPPGPWYRGTATAGDWGPATAGKWGTATTGKGGPATAGIGGTATAGIGGTATAGYMGTATAGDNGTATAGYRGTATAGDMGTATAGNWGTATAGDWGTATAGKWGTATAGKWGTATTGKGGLATAGVGGVIIIRDANGVPHVGRIGENGLKPGKRYRLNSDNEFEEVTA